MARFAARRAPSGSDIRPKALALHDSSVASQDAAATTPKSESSVTESSHEDTPRDSANFKAAQLLFRKRVEAGLTQEELAVLLGESPRQIQRRERGAVWLGALRAVIVLESAAALKAKK